MSSTNFDDSDDDTVVITQESRNSHRNVGNVNDVQIEGIDMENLLDTTNDSAISSVENLNLDHNGSSENEVENEISDKIPNGEYRPDVKDISDND